MTGSAHRSGFDFPPLGPTGEGEPVYPPGTTREDLRFDEHPVYWQRGRYAVTYQLDRPAVAFRCHYPGGSSPCDEATAERFVEWARGVLDPAEATPSVQAFVAYVERCGKVTGRRAREAGWRPNTIAAAVRRDLVRQESRGADLNRYDVYFPKEG